MSEAEPVVFWVWVRLGGNVDGGKGAKDGQGPKGVVSSVENWEFVKVVQYSLLSKS